MGGPLRTAAVWAEGARAIRTQARTGRFFQHGVLGSVDSAFSLKTKREIGRHGQLRPARDLRASFCALIEKRSAQMVPVQIGKSTYGWWEGEYYTDQRFDLFQFDGADNVYPLFRSGSPAFQSSANVKQFGANRFIYLKSLSSISWTWTRQFTRLGVDCYGRERNDIERGTLHLGGVFCKRALMKPTVLSGRCEGEPTTQKSPSSAPAIPFSSKGGGGRRTMPDQPLPPSWGAVRAGGDGHAPEDLRYKSTYVDRLFRVVGRGERRKEHKEHKDASFRVPAPCREATDQARPAPTSSGPRPSTSADSTADLTFDTARRETRSSPTPSRRRRGASLRLFAIFIICSTSISISGAQFASADIEVDDIIIPTDEVTLPPTLISIDAATIYPCGERTVYVSGEGIHEDATVRLTKAGEADIVPDIVRVLTLSSQFGFSTIDVRCEFNFPPGTPGGLWSVVVTNPDAQSATLVDVLEIADDCPRGAIGDLYVCNIREDNILQYNGLTGEFVCIFAERPAVLDLGDFRPFDLSWAPNGNLWVVSTGEGQLAPDSVLEYNGETGEFIDFIVPPTPGIDSPPGLTLSFGGPEANLLLPEFETNTGDEIHMYERAAPYDYVGPVASPSPPMTSPAYGRFASTGRYWILGNANGLIPTVREYDPTKVPFTLVRDMIIESNVRRAGILETPDGCCFLISEVTGSRNNIEKYTIGTDEMMSEFVEVVVPSQNPCLALGPRLPACGEPIEGQCPNFWDAMDGPSDMAWGPNGNLYVTSQRTRVPTDMKWLEFGAQCSFSMGAVHEFNPDTGEQIRVIGKAGTQFFPVVGGGGAGMRDRLYVPGGLEFKPLPGDFGSSGAAFQGDWLVDENDLSRFAAAVDGSAPAHTLAANLLSFDLDRANGVTCDDWPAFITAFELSSGYKPVLPMPTIPEFIDALMDNSSTPCFSDRNSDGKVDGQDIESYVQDVLN